MWQVVKEGTVVWEGRGRGSSLWRQSRRASREGDIWHHLWRMGWFGFWQETWGWEGCWNTHQRYPTSLSVRADSVNGLPGYQPVGLTRHLSLPSTAHWATDIRVLLSEGESGAEFCVWFMSGVWIWMGILSIDIKCWTSNSWLWKACGICLAEFFCFCVCLVVVKLLWAMPFIHFSAYVVQWYLPLVYLCCPCLFSMPCLVT